MLSKVFFAYIFSDVCQIQELFPFLEKLQFQKVIILILLFGIVSNSNLSQVLAKRVRAPQVKAFFLLSIWMVFTVPFSVYPGGAFTFLTQYYWKLLVSFIIVITYVSSIKDVEKTIWAYILGVGLICLFAFIAQGAGRLSFIESHDANELAAHLVIAFPFAFWKMKVTDKLKKIVALLICAFIIAVMIKTQSRGGFLGFIAVTILIIRQIKIFKGKFPFKAIVATAVVGSVALFGYGGSDYIERISTIVNYEDDYNVTSETGRLTVWKNGLQRMVDSPVLGVGVNMFIAADGMFSAGEGKWSSAHNSFIQVGVELGVPGFVLYMFLIVSMLRRLSVISVKTSLDEQDKINTAIAFSFIGGLVAFCVTGFFLSLAYSSTFIFLLAFSCSFAENEQHNR